MVALERTYSSAGFQFVIGQQRDLADYDERKILIRAKKEVPLLINSVLVEFGFLSSTSDKEDRELHKEAAEEMDLALAYWRSKDTSLQKRSGGLLKLLLGDAMGLDLE